MDVGLKDFLTALGLVLIFEGIPYFLAPGRMRLWMVRLLEAPEGALRSLGLAMMGLGLVTVYFVRS
ncbi:MAG: DUF2065 domain-containing protein [Magnetococcales bacterium]|nr:DUF2065 domain-containing protein [Magnetococcales bacterium]